ncbi:MAG: type II toxin-antitoxin system HicA family toxin [Rickettsiales bacterium]
MKSRKLLLRIAEGNFKNIRFRDLQRLLGELGFTLARVSGSHHIYTHPGIMDLVNIQNVAGEAKPYQIRQLLLLIEKYGLAEE